MAPRPLVYWADFLFHIGLGWSAFVLCASASCPLARAAARLRRRLAGAVPVRALHPRARTPQAGNLRGVPPRMESQLRLPAHGSFLPLQEGPQRSPRHADLRNTRRRRVPAIWHATAPSHRLLPASDLRAPLRLPAALHPGRAALPSPSEAAGAGVAALLLADDRLRVPAPAAWRAGRAQLEAAGAGRLPLRSDLRRADRSGGVAVPGGDPVVLRRAAGVSVELAAHARGPHLSQPRRSADEPLRAVPRFGRYPGKPLPHPALGSGGSALSTPHTTSSRPCPTTRWARPTAAWRASCRKAASSSRPRERASGTPSRACGGRRARRPPEPAGLHFSPGCHCDGTSPHSGARFPLLPPARPSIPSTWRGWRGP